MRTAGAIFFALGTSTVLSAQRVDLGVKAKPAVEPAVDGVISAFQTHAIVGLCDRHGLAQEEDFYVNLIRDPRFATNVGNVVVEFGGAAQQSTIDRYVNGEDVPYDQLRRVWNETVGWTPTVTRLGYVYFFAQVRAVNQTLKPEERIHVWLGNPPIDWSQITTRAEAYEVLHQTDRYPANLIKTQLLDKGKKALVIYGGAHFYEAGTIKSLVESSYPKSFFMITPYIGFLEEACSATFEQNHRSWTKNSLVLPVRGTELEGQLQAPGCRFFPGFHFGADVPTAEQAKALIGMENEASGVDGDALLYLGPAASLTESPTIPDLYMDEQFRSEINRRRLLMSGKPLNSSIPTASPVFIHSYEDAGDNTRK